MENESIEGRFICVSDTLWLKELSALMKKEFPRKNQFLYFCFLLKVLRLIVINLFFRCESIRSFFFFILFWLCRVLISDARTSEFPYVLCGCVWQASQFPVFATQFGVFPEMRKRQNPIKSPNGVCAGSRYAARHVLELFGAGDCSG